MHFPLHRNMMLALDRCVSGLPRPAPRRAPMSPERSGARLQSMPGIRVVGAGVGRTGTVSLKIALERLLGGRCYHMSETFGRPEHITMWRRAANGSLPDWDAVFDGFVAIIDWPAAAFWREISDHFPDAIVLLSERSDADTWWSSANATIFEILR